MTTSERPYRKKLIEVALPLNAINVASAREKSIRHGHPSTLHLWWSRKPLATCRAVLFASLIDDPSEHPELFPTEQEQTQERERLFRLIEALVTWENSNNSQVFAAVHAEIQKATGNNPPSVLDPFCGGGSIPLEAQRLGLEAYGSDLNPVAVLISKALVEIPPKFAGKPPVHSEAKPSLMHRDWHGAQGLAEDIRYYGKWMRDEAEKRIGHLYPQATLPKEYGGGEATVIAWLWARTVTCPNPVCGMRMPLTSKWWLSKKTGRETWAEPQIDRSTHPPTLTFEVKTGKGTPQDGTVNRQGARCLNCGEAVPFEYVRSEGKAGRMSQQLMAIVAEGQRNRVYLAPTKEQVETSEQARPTDVPDTDLPIQALGFRIQSYGMTKHRDLFTPRQLTALTTFSDLVQEARVRVRADAETRGLVADDVALHEGGTGADAYADAVATYLACAVDRLTMTGNNLVRWNPVGEKAQHAFGRQSLPMIWDFAEANFFASATGSAIAAIELEAEPVERLGHNVGFVEQHDAMDAMNSVVQPIISTDPPYYDNIGYADLSDFFYVWLRRSLSSIYPNLFRTVLVPKAQELIATPYRFGGNKSMAQEFFEVGLGKSFEQMRAVQHPDFPLTVYYAFKQAESESDDSDTLDEAITTSATNSQVTASTGWETMLEGLIKAGFAITGTWPMRTEMKTRQVAMNANALASSIVLVCRPRAVDAPVASRRQFLNELRRELPKALVNLQRGTIAPVDLAQASIGPGMAIYSRYSKVVESDGTPLRVRAALQLINRSLDEVLAEQEGEYDAETRWAIAWFEEYGYEAGEYGRAETLSKAKNMSLQGLVDAGFLASRGGKVHLLKRDELAAKWDIKQAERLTVWEVMQYMIRALDEKGGEVAAGDIRRAVGERGDIARDLAYRLYTMCERKGRASEALAYNSLVTSWGEINRLARREGVRSNELFSEVTFLG